MEELIKELKEAIDKFEKGEISPKELAIEIEAIGQNMLIASDN